MVISGDVQWTKWGAIVHCFVVTVYCCVLCDATQGSWSLGISNITCYIFNANQEVLGSIRLNFGQPSFALASVDRDIKPLHGLVSRCSIGRFKRTHTFLDKSRLIPVLWTVNWGHKLISQKKKTHCDPLTAVWLRSSTTEPCICCKQVAEKPGEKQVKIYVKCKSFVVQAFFL